MKFRAMAYSLRHRDIFQAAVRLVYGDDFEIKEDLSSRMVFECKICNREMNSETAVAEHFRSGGHQKNRDKKYRERGESNLDPLKIKYSPDSLHYKLACSHIKPLGLQMIEEYACSHRSPYFKCNLCGAHGKLDSMYHHAIGNRHTEKYIKSACVLENSILTSTEREEIRHQLVKAEGMKVEAIKTIRGDMYFPRKWKEEGRVYGRQQNAVKKDARSPSSSPSPGPSRSRSSVHEIGHSSLRLSKRSPKESPTSSPERYIKRSPRESYKISPDSSPVRSHSREKSPLSQYRNKSPPGLPSLDIKLELDDLPVAPSPPPVLPPPPPQRPEKKDKEIQKFDLEELMIQFNFIVKTHDMSAADIQTAQDEKLAIDLMMLISEALYSCIRIDDSQDNPETARLRTQQETLRKIMGYIKLRLEATWNDTNKQKDSS